MANTPEKTSRPEPPKGRVPKPIPPPPAPLDPLVRTNELVDVFRKEAGLSPEAAERLKGLVLDAIDERFEEVQDVRLGRVLGSALATL